MTRNLIAAVSGVLFGLGLGVSHMVNPQKVRDFLDVAGTGDPSLGLVMGGAVVVFFAAWRLRLGRAAPLFAPAFQISERTRVWDVRLIGGAATFGAGWGMVGFCPGPSISSLAYLLPQSLVFVAAMAAGSALAYWVPHKPAQVPAAA